MVKRLFLLLLGIVLGIGLVLACGDSGSGIDAGRDATAANCSMCEPTLTSDRFYVVRNRETRRIGLPTGSVLTSQAECREGDVVIGGGCWIYTVDSNDHFALAHLEHPLLSSGPFPAAPVENDPDVDNVYVCNYENLEDQPVAGFIVVSTAMCFDVRP
jgi:hypothetical protein